MAKVNLELDEFGRVKKCVNCGYVHNYDDEHALYCMQCGYELINKCTNTETRKHLSADVLLNKALGIDSNLLVCGRRLPPEANFCPYCGSESLFYRVTKFHQDEDVPF